MTPPFLRSLSYLLWQPQQKYKQPVCLQVLFQSSSQNFSESSFWNISVIMLYSILKPANGFPSPQGYVKLSTWHKFPWYSSLSFDLHTAAHMLKIPVYKSFKRKYPFQEYEVLYFKNTSKCVTMEKSIIYWTFEVF